MRLEQFVHDLEDRLRGLGQRLWKEDAVAQSHEEAEALSEELRRRGAALAADRRSLEEVRGRVRAGEMTAALLSSRVETYVHVADQPEAWRCALELDAVRGRLQEDREQEAALERAVWTQRLRVRQLERRLAEVQANLYESV